MLKDSCPTAREFTFPVRLILSGRLRYRHELRCTCRYLHVNQDGTACNAFLLIRNVFYFGGRQL